MEGIIIKAISGFYYVLNNGNLFECKARGNFRNAGISPAVGDIAVFTPMGESAGIIENIKERKSYLERPNIANIDKLFIVSSYSTPAPDTLMIDRLTVLAVFSGIEPIIVFNKCDMGDFKVYKDMYEAAGFKTYIVSAKTGEGIDVLSDETKDCISTFAGNSGVGKSSILNAVFPELQLKTGDVSEKLGRGRHTTRHTELFTHKNNGFVADTPGFSSVVEISDKLRLKNSLADCFPDFSDFLHGCRFSSCTHTCEKGCGIVDAVSRGEIQQSRHDSYKAMFDELKEVKHWNNR